MKTDDLIVQLARSATPVRPLPSPGARSLRWIGLAMAVAALVVLALGPRHDLRLALARPSYVVALVAMIVASVCAAGAAFALSVPGAERTRAIRGLAIAAALGWPAVWAITLLRTGSSHEGVFHALCAIEIAVVAAAGGTAMFAMLRRAAPLRPGLTAAIAGVAAVSTGGIAAQLVCPLNDPAHQLVGHAMVAAVVAVAVAVVGRRVLIRSMANRRTSPELE